MKTCTACQVDKTTVEFSKDKDKADGLQTRCKECVREYGKMRLLRLSSRSSEELSEDRKKFHPEGLKLCTKCNTTFPISKFGKCLGKPSGLQVHCFKCTSKSALGKTKSLKVRSDKQLSDDTIRLHPDGTKRCRDCLIEKPISAFFVSRLVWDGLTQRCKPCDRYRKKGRDEKNRRVIITRLSELYGNSCLFPGCEEADGLHIDHVMPLALGGPDVFDNYQLLCQHHNCSKGATYVDYRVKKGRNGTSK